MSSERATQRDVNERVEEHLEYLLREARGRMAWPQDKIDELERDLEAFREGQR